MNTEPRYTLDEAKAELARQECLNHGHSYDVLDNRTLGNAPGRPIEVHCAQCNTHWPVPTPGPGKVTVTVDINESDAELINQVRRQIKVATRQEDA